MEEYRENRNAYRRNVSHPLIAFHVVNYRCESLFKVKSEAKPTVQSQRIENQDAVIEPPVPGRGDPRSALRQTRQPFSSSTGDHHPYTFYVFSMTVNAKADIYIPSSSILMRMAGKNFRSATHESLTAFWQQVEEDYATSERKPDTSKYNELIRRHLIQANSSWTLAKPIPDTSSFSKHSLFRRAESHGSGCFPRRGCGGKTGHPVPVRIAYIELTVSLPDTTQPKSSARPSHVLFPVSSSYRYRDPPWNKKKPRFSRAWYVFVKRSEGEGVHQVTLKPTVSPRVTTT
jgi:hypothetical protein